jgi:hypothetical protein
MNKNSISKLRNPQDIIEYVVKHGEWRLKRGKRLSATLPMPFGILNPEKAYKAAKEILEKPKVKLTSMFNHRGQTRLEEMLGIPPPWEEPWPGARKVPHTCYQWF